MASVRPFGHRSAAALTGAETAAVLFTTEHAEQATPAGRPAFISNPRRLRWQHGTPRRQSDASGFLFNRRTPNALFLYFSGPYTFYTLFDAGARDDEGLGKKQFAEGEPRGSSACRILNQVRAMVIYGRSRTLQSPLRAINHACPCWIHFALHTRACLLPQ
ncbi:hypothetical protein MRX96_051326 [Rhipicephalus microplus]